MALNSIMSRVRASFRLMLLVGSAVMAVIAASIIIIALVYGSVPDALNKHDYPLGGYTVWFWMAANLFVLSLLAWTGAFYRQKRILNAFTGLAAVYVLVGVAVIAWSVHSQQDTVGQVSERLNDVSRSGYLWHYASQQPRQSASRPAQVIGDAELPQPSAVNIEADCKESTGSKKDGGQMILTVDKQTRDHLRRLGAEKADSVPGEPLTNFKQAASSMTANNKCAKPVAEPNGTREHNEQSPVLRSADDDTRLWDDLQNALECCGWNSSDDWKPHLLLGKLYPASCCAKPVVEEMIGLKGMVFLHFVFLAPQKNFLIVQNTYMFVVV